MTSQQERWNWDAVPWRVGEDFGAPTCATCHNSGVGDPSGATILERTHDFGARLWVRIFGLIYAHPQPKRGNTYRILNADSLSLPTTLFGESAREFVIDNKEQSKRRAAMVALCASCHSSSWANGHFTLLDSAIARTDSAVMAATRILATGWDKGIADPANPFDDHLEHLWISQWLFYANSVRYAAAMGGPDYAAFKNGWWKISTGLEKMRDAVNVKRKRRR